MRTSAFRSKSPSSPRIFFWVASYSPGTKRSSPCETIQPLSARVPSRTSSVRAAPRAERELFHHNPHGVIRQTPLAIGASPEAGPDSGLGQDGVQQLFEVAHTVLSEDVGVAA